MSKFFISLVINLIFVSTAFACTCPTETDYWWRSSRTVVLVKIASVSTANEHPMSREKCRTPEFCVQKQIAKFTLIETFKGKAVSITSLATGYGSGDCGMPLIAGAFYVLFLRDSSGTVGMCNAAGPYLQQLQYPGGPTDELQNFLSSIRKASKNPQYKVIARPRPIAIGAGR